MRLLVIDGNSIANRAFYGIKVLTTRDGRFTNAIYGFLNILLSLEKECNPDEVAVAFDLKAPTFRHKMYDGYKATRHGMPAELAQQMPVLKQLLADLGYRTVTAEGWEADDILGTLAAACAARKDDCFLATGDRDSLQLVSDTTTVLLASTVMGRSQTVVMDVDAVREKYGVDPIQLIEVKSLMGDTSDNIPGVKGIGEKTALNLVKTFGTLENVYENLDSPVIKPKQRENLQTYKADAEMSRVLGTIRTDAPIDTDEGAYARAEGDKPAAVATLTDLEIVSLIPRLGLDGVTAAHMEPEEALPEVAVTAMPDVPKGVYLVAQKPARIEKQGNKNVEVEPACWYAVQENQVHPLDEATLVQLLDDAAVQLDVFDSAPLYALAMAQDGWGESIRWDGKLAAYLLNASASRYDVEELETEYSAKAAFVCPDFPQAGSLQNLFDTMKARITEQEMDALYNDIEFPLAQVLADMTRLGMLVDKEGLQQFGVKIREKLDDALQRVYDQVGYEFNVNSPKQLGEALFEKMGLPHGKKTKTGWSTNAATLEKLRGEAPVVDDILEYRTYQKLSSTYVDGLLKVIGEDGRIHSIFNQTEARTGRLSSLEPNLQNIPIRTELGSQLRDFFIAKSGCILLDADYSQIELRILAHITGDEHMQTAFRSGADIHRSTAAKIYNIPEEDVTPRLRSSAKAINFGIMYGKGAYSLSQDIGVSVKEADTFLQNYLNTFPKVDEYMSGCIAEAKEKGYCSTLFGRRRYLPELQSSNFQVRSSGERMARNTPIQGTAADVIKLAMVRVWQRLRAEKMESHLILTVHDELIVEAPLAEAEKAGKILAEEMMGCVQYAVPLTAEVNQGKTWLEAH